MKTLAQVLLVSGVAAQGLLDYTDGDVDALAELVDASTDAAATTVDDAAADDDDSESSDSEFSSVSVSDDEDADLTELGHKKFKVTKAMRKTFAPIFFMERKKHNSLPWGSKARNMWNKWMRGAAKRDQKLLNKVLYRKGGIWDKFAGKDGRMSMKESNAMYNVMS